jgi:1-acyl-sn-glycerol-3-phosphate acyltransferase
MINFTKTTKHLLTKGNYLLMYPEEAEWHFYEKPRPFKDGAFHMAVSNRVPIIPLFITFQNKKRSHHKKATIHILEAIFLDEGLLEKDKIQFLKEKSFQAFKQKYEEFYQKQLIYETE